MVLERYMQETGYPQILFPNGFDERIAFEAFSKGWICATVILPDGHRYVFLFVDPPRLQQDIHEQFESGASCFTEPGLVVIPEVTNTAIEKAVQFLWKHGSFAHLKPETNT